MNTSPSPVTHLLAKELADHRPCLAKRAQRLTKNEADAADLLQETYLHALEALRGADAAPENLRAWLLTIMRNHWFNAVRHRTVCRNAQPELASRTSVGESLAEVRVLYGQISRAWSQLPERAQQIAELCILDGDSHESVSRRFGMSAGGVATSIHRTRASLRWALAGREAEPLQRVAFVSSAGVEDAPITEREPGGTDSEDAPITQRDPEGAASGEGLIAHVVASGGRSIVSVAYPQGAAASRDLE